MEPKSLAELIAESKKVADRKQYQELMAQIAEKEIELQLAENAQRLEEEARIKAQYEQERSAHLAEIEELERKKRNLASNEERMIECMVTGATLTKIQISTWNEAKKLVKHLNREREKYGTPEQEIEELDVFGTDYTWQNVAKGLLQRVTELLMWNDNRPEHFRPVTPKFVKMQSTQWGLPQPDDETQGDDAGEELEE